MERELDEAANRTAYFLRFTPENRGSENGAPKDVCRHGSSLLDPASNSHSVLQLFDCTPHRALDSWRGQSTHSFFIGGDLGCVGAIPTDIAKAAAVPRLRRPSLCA